MSRQQLFFLVRFALCVGGLVGVFHVAPGPFASLYLQPISWSTASVLSLIGLPTTIDASSLVDGFCVLETEFTLLRVEFECTGLFSLFVYSAAVLAYPAPLVQRAVGVAGGLPAFVTYSVARLTVIGVIDHVIPWWLGWFHIYLMVLLNLGFFLFLWAIWVNRCVIRQPIR